MSGEPYSSKLQKILEKDLYEFMKELCENTNLNITCKIAIAQPFAVAVSQLKLCIDILKQYE